MESFVYMAKLTELPDVFLKRFIREDVRDRDALEWSRRPEKLHYRIAHNAPHVFFDECKDATAEFDPDETVMLLCGKRVQEVEFSEAAERLGSGVGLFIVSEDGSRFIAEMEYVKWGRADKFAGSC